VAPAHLERALDDTARGKRRRPDVAWAIFRREAIARDLSDRLRRGTWRPAGFAPLFIRDPKPRVIARAPLEDRIVHAALVTAMRPALTRSLLPECAACRPGLGNHRAVLRLHGLMRAHRCFVHLDVRAYFPSIDRDVVRRLLARRIRDARFLAVVDQVLESGAALYRDPEVRAHAGLTPSVAPRPARWGVGYPSRCWRGRSG